jgi:hypothetical protein
MRKVGWNTNKQTNNSGDEKRLLVAAPSEPFAETVLDGQFDAVRFLSWA